LRLFLGPRHRQAAVQVAHDGTATLGHLVESLGVPLTEVGSLTIGGRPVPPSHRPAAGDVVFVGLVARPQRLPVSPPRFVLDVHLGTLARRLRLLGVDTAYANWLDDDALIEQANAERRALLTQDRGLLRRRRLWLGGTCGGAFRMSNSPTCWSGSPRRSSHGPGAPPATACSQAWTRPRWPAPCSPARGAPTTRSPAADLAGGSTGAGRTAGG
jgi:hypothetical protein